MQMELLDGLKSDVADNNGALNSKRAQEAALTEKVSSHTHKRGSKSICLQRD